MKEILEELSKIEPQYSKSELYALDSEDKFMDCYVEFLKQTISLLYIIIGDKYSDKQDGIPIKLNRNEAIIAGNITRLVKLNISLLENVCNQKLEICYIVSRCLAETAINLNYMLANGEPNVLRNYIKHSLITEKELLNKVQTNIKMRNGDKLDIENRIEFSIMNSFRESDFQLDDVNRSSKWKSIAQRASELKNKSFYGIYYGISSHVVHGNWQDILLHHLEDYEDGFKLNLEWNIPRPQILDTPIALNLEVLKSFLENKTVSAAELVKEKINLLCEYHQLLIDAHEEFVQT